MHVCFFVPLFIIRLFVDMLAFLKQWCQVSCLTILGAGTVDGVGLKSIPSESKTAPVIMTHTNQSDGGFLIPTHGPQSQGPPKLHIDIPPIGQIDAV